MTPEEFNTICKEFDAAPDDFSWDEGHPIFCLAEENDALKKKLRDNQSSRSPALLTNDLSPATLGELVSKALETGQIVVVKSDEIQLLPPEAAKEFGVWLDEHRAELVAASAQLHSIVVS